MKSKKNKKKANGKDTEFSRRKSSTSNQSKHSLKESNTSILKSSNESIANSSLSSKKSILTTDASPIITSINIMVDDPSVLRLLPKKKTKASISLSILENPNALDAMLSKKLHKVNKLDDRNKMAPLHYAAMFATEDTIQRLIDGSKDRLDFNLVDGHGRTPLIHACLSNQLDLINLLLGQSEVTVDTIDKFGYTCIHYCIAINNLEALQLLYPKSSNPNELYNGESYLHCALRLNKPDLAMVLIEKGADVHLKDSLGKTPLHLACELELESLCKHLLSLGANPRQTDSDGKYPVDYLTANETLIDLLQVQDESNIREDELQEDSSPTVSLSNFTLENIESEEDRQSNVEVKEDEVKNTLEDAPLISLQNHDDQTEVSIDEDISIEEDLPLPDDEDEGSNEVFKNMKNITLHPMTNTLHFTPLTSKVPTLAPEMPLASSLSVHREETMIKDDILKSEEQLNTVIQKNEKNDLEQIEKTKEEEINKSTKFQVSTIKEKSVSNPEPPHLLLENESLSKVQLTFNKEFETFRVENPSEQSPTVKMNESTNAPLNSNSEWSIKHSDSINRSDTKVKSMNPVSSDSTVEPTVDPSLELKKTDIPELKTTSNEENLSFHHESVKQELNMRPFKPRLEPIRLQPLSSTPSSFASKPSIFLAPLRGPRPSSIEKEMTPSYLNHTSTTTTTTTATTTTSSSSSSSSSSSISKPPEPKSLEPNTQFHSLAEGPTDKETILDSEAFFKQESVPLLKLSDSVSKNVTIEPSTLVIESTVTNQPPHPPSIASIAPLDSAFSPDHKQLDLVDSKGISSKADESETWDIIEEIEMENEIEEEEDEEQNDQEEEKRNDNEENEGPLEEGDTDQDEEEVIEGGEMEEEDEEEEEDDDNEEEEEEDVDDVNHNEEEVVLVKEHEGKKEDELTREKKLMKEETWMLNSNTKVHLSDSEMSVQKHSNPIADSMLVVQENPKLSLLHFQPYPVSVQDLTLTKVECFLSETSSTTRPESFLNDEVEHVSTPTVEPNQTETKEIMDEIEEDTMEEMETSIEAKEEAFTNRSTFSSESPQINPSPSELKEVQDNTISLNLNMQKNEERVKERSVLKSDKRKEISECLEIDTAKKLHFLTEKVVTQETTILALQHQLNNAKDQCQTLEAQLKTEQQCNKEYELTLKKVEETSQERLQLAETRLLELQSLHAQLRDNEKDSDAFHGQLAYITKLQAELQSLSSKYEALENEFHDLQLRYKETESHHESEKVHLEQAFETEKSSLALLINDLKLKVQALETQHEQDQQEMSQVKEQVSTFKEQLQFKESNVNQITSENTRLTTMYEQLMVEFQQKDQKLKEHQLNTTQLRTDYANLESEKKLLHIEHTELQMKYQQVESEFQTLQEAYQQVHLHLEETKRSNVEKETQMHQVTSEYELKLQQLQSQVERVTQLEAVYEGVKQECETHLSTLTAEKETQRHMEVQLKTLESTLQVKEEQTKQLQNQLKSLQQEFTQNKQQLSELTIQLEQALDNAKQMESLHSSVKKTADLYYLKIEQLNAGKQEQDDSYYQLQRQVQLLEGNLMQEKQLTTKYQSELQAVQKKIEELDLQASKEASEFHARELDLIQQFKLLKIEYEAKMKDLSQSEKKLEEQSTINRHLQKELDASHSMKMVQSHHQWQEMQAKLHRSQLQITQLEGQVETLQLKLALKEDLVRDALAQETELKEHQHQLKLQLKQMEQHLLDTQSQFLDQCRATREAEDAKADLKTKLLLETPDPCSTSYPRTSTSHPTQASILAKKNSNSPPTSPLPLSSGLNKFDSPLFSSSSNSTTTTTTTTKVNNNNNSTEKAIMDKLTSLESKIKKLASTPTNFISSSKPFTFSSTLPSSIHSIPFSKQPFPSHFSSTQPLPTARGLAETISKLKRQNMILDAKLMGFTKNNASNLTN